MNVLQVRHALQRSQCVTRNLGPAQVQITKGLAGTAHSRRSADSQLLKDPWVLKNSDFERNGQNPGDVKCLEIRKDRLKRFLTQFCFCDFRPKEFFNSHIPLRSLAGLDAAQNPFRRRLCKYMNLHGRSTKVRFALKQVFVGHG